MRQSPYFVVHAPRSCCEAGIGRHQLAGKLHGQRQVKTILEGMREIDRKKGGALDILGSRSPQIDDRSGQQPGECGKLSR